MGIAGEGVETEPRERLSLRRRTYLALNPVGGLTVTSVIIIGLILLSTAAAVAETEPVVSAGRETQFRALELMFAALFAVEYVARIWSAPECGRSRLHYATSPSSLIDLFVVIGSFLPMIGGNMLILRLARVARMLRIARLGRFSRAFHILGTAIRSRAGELTVTVMLMGFFLLLGATVLYWVEGSAQPEDFGSIPRAMWWATVTMTTVGYGDVVPGSALGKLFGGLISVSGLFLIAIPTGILAASFTEELSARRRAEEEARAAKADKRG